MAYEIAVALLMLSKGRCPKWGLLGGIVFLVAIAPLGVWTLGNPIMAVALAHLLTKEYDRSPPQMLGIGPSRARGGAGHSAHERVWPTTEFDASERREGVAADLPRLTNFD